MTMIFEMTCELRVRTLPLLAPSGSYARKYCYLQVLLKPAESTTLVRDAWLSDRQKVR